MKREIKFKILPQIFITGLILCLVMKARLGLHSDEVHSIAVGDMIARGNSFFKECWFYLQMSAVFNSPLIFLYRKIVGNLEGVIFFFRVMTIVVQLMVGMIYYRTFRKEISKRYILAAVVMLGVYVPDFQSFTYKQEIIWFSLLLTIFLYRYSVDNKVINLVWCGLFLAFDVLAYPTTIILVWFVLISIWLIDGKEEKKKKILHWGIIISVCIVCALVYLIYVFKQIGIKNFLVYFPKVYTDDNLNTNFITKLLHPLIKWTILGVLTMIVLAIRDRVGEGKDVWNKCKLPVITVALLAAWGGQAYIERKCITWHCINYPYTLAVFIIWYLYKKDKSQINRKLVQTFGIVTVGVAIAMALASNQGNITSMYGNIMAAMTMVVMLGRIDRRVVGINTEKRLIVISMLIMSILSGLLPVYEQESMKPEKYGERNVFTKRMYIQEGPAKGLKLGTEMYNAYIKLRKVISDNVQENDALLIVDDNTKAALGYLCADANYATYSPQGGWGMATSDRMIDYYSNNPNKEPTVVIICEDYVQDVEEWLETTSLGDYVASKFERIDIEESYYTFKKFEKEDKNGH